MTIRDFDEQLAQHLKDRNGKAAVAMLLSDPAQRMSLGFNRHMNKVDAEDIGTAFLKPMAVMEVKVDAGAVRSGETFFKLLGGVQKRIGMKLAAKAARRSNPRLRRRAGEEAAQPRPLFVHSEEALSGAPARERDPSYALQRRELFTVLLAKARLMGRLPSRVFREVRRFAAECGTEFGAFTEVAKRAAVDGEGRVVAIRHRDPDGIAASPPNRRVVRQIRELFQKAEDTMQG